MPHAFLVLNPVSTLVIFDPQLIQQFCENHFTHLGWTIEVYQTTGHEDVRQIVRQAVERHPKPDVVIAAGGDGTISDVADALVGANIPLAILPAGTGNLLAQELQIPIDVPKAVELITSSHRVRTIDAMLVNGRHRVLNVGVGMSSAVIQATRRQHKRIFGLLAYIWNVLVQLSGLRLNRFTVTADSRYSVFRASEVMLTNGGVIGLEPLRWDPCIAIDDGIINICVVRARTLSDFLSLAVSVLLRRQNRHPKFSCLTALHDITIQTEKPLLVEADGDLIGHTPIQVRVIPHALRVIVPEHPGAMGVTLGNFKIIRHLPLLVNTSNVNIDTIRPKQDK
jgi:YegS/Rv2252/BmrU family lipid kinase